MISTHLYGPYNVWAGLICMVTGFVLLVYHSPLNSMNSEHSPLNSVNVQCVSLLVCECTMYTTVEGKVVLLPAPAY